MKNDEDEVLTKKKKKKKCTCKELQTADPTDYSF